MKRIIGGIFIALLLVAMPTKFAHAAADDFKFSSFHADYYLGADSEGRSTLKTVETLVAAFPEVDQNHGIERAIPKRYDGHTTSLTIQSVTDAKGNGLHYDVGSDTNDNKVIRVGDENTYVHGVQTYVITYMQRDVTKAYIERKDVEFYWNTNGLDWAEPFDTVTATVHLSDSLKPTFTKAVNCYYGEDGSKTPCTIATDGSTITASSSNLARYQNMTVAIGFTPGTFRSYQMSLLDKIMQWWQYSLLVTSAVGIGLVIWLSRRYTSINNRSRELKPIPVEYIPPNGVSVLTSAQLGDGTQAEITAAIIDLAVRHFITITQTSEKSLFHTAEYELEIKKSASELLLEEKDFIRALFGTTSLGAKLQTKTLKSNYTLASSLRTNADNLTQRIRGDYGFRSKDTTNERWFKTIGSILLVVSIVTVSPLILVAALVSFVCAWILWPLSNKGLELRRYLAGLKVYIDVAEKDRINMLQSPEGVEKTGVSIDGTSDKKLVHLYERVLPYAVLFGQEKQWNKQLAARYEEVGSSPDWYIGQGAFNAALFTSAMNDFTGTMNNYGSSSNSSSGGTSGGGSSGGGGGGGGGGGW